jgi:hypothetical protein
MGTASPCLLCLPARARFRRRSIIIHPSLSLLPRWLVRCRLSATDDQLLATIESQPLLLLSSSSHSNLRYIVSTMLSRIALQAVKRALPVRPVAFAPFSTELIPGVGMGKTSTGIVSGRTACPGSNTKCGWLSLRALLFI